MGKTLGVVALGTLLALAGIVMIGGWRWRRDTSAAIQAISAVHAPPAAFDPRELEGLPEPVRRYFQRSLTPGVALVRAFHHTQVGEFAMNGWRPMRATQVHVTSPPAFVWDARIALMPGMSVNVRDSYSPRGAGLLARVQGLYTVASAGPSPQLTEGALQRFLGEAVWFPTALLPSQGVRWAALTNHSARALLDRGGVTATLDFEFNAEGDVTGASTAARWKENGGHFTREPWRTQCGAWEWHGGLRIPMECEVAWMDGQRAVPYWRARISDVVFR